MLNQKNFVRLFISLFVAGVVTGCGTGNRIQSTEMPGKPMLDEGTPAQKAARTQLERYVVKNHDCLWEIAGQSRVYGDPFQWPMLFKANRDQIKDPDLIYPRQTLTVSKGYSLEERVQAKRMAMSTPKYVPHTKPRETLPVGYF